MDYSPPGSPVYGDYPGKNTGVCCHALLQGIFPTQGSNPGLPHCSWILHRLSHQGCPRILEWVAYPLSSRSSQPRTPPLQADSLPAEPRVKPKNTGMGSLALLQQSFLIQESKQGLLHCREILYQLSYQGFEPELKTKNLRSWHLVPSLHSTCAPSVAQSCPPL